MPHDAGNRRNGKHALTGHALRNANLRLRSLARSQDAPPLAKTAVKIRAKLLGITRLEFARQSSVSRGALRDLELGIHKPTCLTMLRYVEFIRRQENVPAETVEEVCQLYSGAPETVPDLVARYEMRAGSLRNLARMAKLSPATLWEYRRGRFPVPYSLLLRFCRMVGEDEQRAESVWRTTERKLFLDRGYPPAWAELCMWCAREGRTEGWLRSLGVKTKSFRHLCYLELPPWDEVVHAAEKLSRSPAELRELKQMWQRGLREQQQNPEPTFGGKVMELREQQNMSRRELANLFRIGGKKPARIIKHIEEDGMYSLQAFPAGLVTMLTTDVAEQTRLLDLWDARRRMFQCRHRPEHRNDIRLVRERYGFEIAQTAKFLGYSNLEYQKVERGIEKLLDSAKTRIIDAIHQAGKKRVQDVLNYRSDLATAAEAWRSPSTIRELIERLCTREGGLLPLVRCLKLPGLKESWLRRLRAIARGEETPTWPQIQEIARAGEVIDLSQTRRDWAVRYRAWLISKGHPPLAVELRLLIAEVAPSLRAFSSRLSVGCPVLVRDLLQIGRQEQLKWFHVERLIKAAGLSPTGDRWHRIETLWQPYQPQPRKRAKEQKRG